MKEEVDPSIAAPYSNESPNNNCTPFQCDSVDACGLFPDMMADFIIVWGFGGAFDWQDYPGCV